MNNTEFIFRIMSRKGDECSTVSFPEMQMQLQQVFDLPGKEAITLVRKYIDGAVETYQQNQLIIGDLNAEIKNL